MGEAHQRGARTPPPVPRAPDSEGAHGVEPEGGNAEGSAKGKLLEEHCSFEHSQEGQAVEAVPGGGRETIQEVQPRLGPDPGAVDGLQLLCGNKQG